MQKNDSLNSIKYSFLSALKFFMVLLWKLDDSEFLLKRNRIWHNLWFFYFAITIDRSYHQNNSKDQPIGRKFMKVKQFILKQTKQALKSLVMNGISPTSFLLLVPLTKQKQKNRVWCTVHSSVTFFLFSFLFLLFFFLVKCIWETKCIQRINQITTTGHMMRQTMYFLLTPGVLLYWVSSMV